MSQVSCSFCTHRNPSDAKFCNQCGSPLGLKPCPACEAVNETAAVICHQCGAALEAPPVDALEGSVAPSSESEVASTVPERLAPAETIAAGPLAADTAQHTPLRTPESLAGRLERNLEARSDDRIEPRIAHAEDRVVHGIEAPSPILRGNRMPSRRRAGRAPLAFALLIVIAGAGYYAYRNDVSDLARRFALTGHPADVAARAEPSPEASPSAATARGVQPAETPAQAEQPVARAPGASPATAAADAQSATQPNPAAAASTNVQPRAPAHDTTASGAGTQTPVSAAKSSAKPVASTSRSDDEAAPQRIDQASRSRREADAAATQRLIARDLGAPAVSAATTRIAPLDRDAAETQRLIERDLGPFLHRDDRGTTQGGNPATH